MPVWKTTHPGVEAMSVAVMGCVVNGPGESKAASIGISLPGTGEAPNCPIVAVRLIAVRDGAERVDELIKPPSERVFAPSLSAPASGATADEVASQRWREYREDGEVAS